MGYTTWQVTVGNGARIGLIEAKKSVFCGAVLGTSIRTSCVLISATLALLVGTTAAAFVVCQDFLLRSSRLTLAHA